MGDQLIDENQLLESFPLWTLVDAAIQQSRGLPHSIAILQTNDFGRFVPVFTDFDLAKRFTDETPVPNKRPLRLKTAQSLRSILRDVEKMGVVHAGIDISLGPPRSGRFCQIQAMLKPSKVLRLIPP
jgi:hypothetical protein